MTKRIELKNQEDDAAFDTPAETIPDPDITLETTWKSYIYFFLIRRIQ